MTTTRWWRRRLALGAIHLAEALDWAAHRMVDTAARLAPQEFAAAELIAQLEIDLAQPVDYDRKGDW